MGEKKKDSKRNDDVSRRGGPPVLRSRGRVAEILEPVLENSVADETELVWFERQHGCVRRDPSGAVASELEPPRVTVLIRALAGGRLGWHRTEVTDAAMLQNGVRHSLGVATCQPRSNRSPFFPKPGGGEGKGEGKKTAAGGNAGQKPGDEAGDDLAIRDRKLEQLDEKTAARWLDEWCQDGERARFHFSRTHLAVWNSHGLRRHAHSTEATLDVRRGDGPGDGYASSSARAIESLQPEAVFERARARAVGAGEQTGAAAALPAGPTTVVLAPEAVIELLDIANIFAFAGRAYLDGTSFLSQHRGVQVFDRSVHVRDDALRIPGMPFPFDLEGVTKRPIDLIVEGRASTPALSRSQGGEAGLEPTGQSVGGEDAMFGNLFLLPGHQDLPDLLRQADGGLFISHLERPECHDPKRLGIRTVARGIRRIEGGELGAPMPDAVWQTSLLAALARLAGIGRHPVVRAMPSTPLGGICAPALALADSSGFTALEPSG